MAKMKNAGAVAAMAAAVVCICDVQADPINWDAVSSKTYTVPADTTNEVTTAEEFAKVTNLLTKVIFANENSTLRFTVSTFPDSVTFQGPGTVLMDETIVLDKQYTYLRRSLGEGDATNFVKFVFAKDVDNDSPTTIRYLRCAQSPFSNATIFFNGQLGTNVQTYAAGNARLDVGENFSISNSAHLTTVIGYYGVLRQRGGDIVQYGITGDGPSLSTGDKVGAWLMEGGSYYVENGGKYTCFYGNYSHIRQTGGLINIGRFAVNNNASGDIRPDFVFGGNGVVTIRGKSCPTRPCLFAFTGSVDFKHTNNTTYHAFYNFSGGNKGGNCEGTIWVHNGGVASYSFYPWWATNTGDQTSGPTNNVFSFDGGLRGFPRLYSLSGENLKLCLFGFTPWVRFYEKGGGFFLSGTNNHDFRNIEFLEPEGNVVKSITLSDELKNKVFQYPPSVEIWDEGGTGTNAAAVVDYDFDTGRITNITMMCKGENYTTPKANLRYKAGAANRLLTTPLDCVVGPEQGGDLTFAATNRGAAVSLYAMTNYTHGALIVDMDRNGVADHGAYTGSAYGNFLHLYYSHNASVATNCTMFPNITNIVLKSGGLDSEYGWGYNHQRPTWGILPNCWKLELYGGHLIGGSARFEDVTIGGEVWLRNHALDSTRAGDIRICRSRVGDDDWQDFPGFLTVDVACLTNGITPKVKYGNVRFYCGKANTTLPALAGKTNSVVTVKNWEVIPKNRRWKTILDLTETTVNVPSSDTVPTPLGHRVSTPDIVLPEGSEEELRIKWEMNPEEPTKPYRLLARRIGNGTILIFK